MADPAGPRTILALSSYFKGNRFLQACKQAGWRVLLLTLESRRHEPWAREALDDIYFMPAFDPLRPVIHGIAYLMRSTRIDAIVPLDDFDVEVGAALRDHFRLGGLDLGTMRLFRDKLAMRLAARAAGLAVPAFTAVWHDPDVDEFLSAVPPPWLLKPRMQASSIGIQKYHAGDEVRRRLQELGDARSDYLLEQFVPGDLFHVDTLSHRGEVVFAEVGQYHRPLLEVWTGGGIFGSKTLSRDVTEHGKLTALTARVLRDFRLPRGASHTEWIRAAADGQFYFLETSARVGGANISDMVEAATGVNLWCEWARIEMAGDGPYPLPPIRQEYGGVVVSLCKFEQPDYGPFSDPEVWLKVRQKNHIGLVVRATTLERVEELLLRYREIIARDYLAVLPPTEKPTN
jgi:biotin carboxylase